MKLKTNLKLNHSFKVEIKLDPFILGYLGGHSIKSLLVIYSVFYLVYFVLKIWQKNNNDAI
jgi:hypothetical protein